MKRFSELAIGDKFLWQEKDEYRHFPGPYQKIGEDRCLPLEGGYGDYQLFRAGQMAFVIEYNN